MPGVTIETVQKLTDRLDALEKKMAELSGTVTEVSDQVKVTREVKQVVVEREGDQVKVRVKVLLKSANKTEEIWEDGSDKLVNKEEIINGA